MGVEDELNKASTVVGSRAGTTVAALAVTAINIFVQNKVQWTLADLDGGQEIVGQFPATGLTENVSGTWAETSTLGLAQPILQFVKGNLETISFSARVWCKHRGLLGTGLGKDDIELAVEVLKNLPRQDPDLGRPHVYLLTIGSQFSQEVVVRGVGGITYDEMIATEGGVLRGATFAMDLARYVPYDADAIAQGESLITPVRTGETYENIAKRVLGDPFLGLALRRRNPDNLFPPEGDLIHVPTARILRSETYPLAHQSFILKTGDSQDANRVAAYDERSQPVLTHVLTEDW